MEKKGNKYKENIPACFVENAINTYPVSKLMPVAKLVCGSDYEVRFYHDKKHPLYFHNQEALRRALLRCFAMEEFDYRKTIIQGLNLKEAWTRKCAEKYVVYAEDHCLEIAGHVNDCFDKKKDWIREELLTGIRGLLEPVPAHFVWYRGGCPYDFSGELRKDGLVDLDQTVSDFLEHEYTGGSIATYESGCGLQWMTYGDGISYDTLEFAENIMQEGIREFLEGEFGEEIPQDVFEEVINTVHDCIYDECVACNFFFWEGAVEFAGIGEMTLSEVVKKEK